MCYFVLFWVNRSRNMATILTVSREKFSSVGPPQFEQAVLVKFATVEKSHQYFLHSWNCTELGYLL